MNLRENHPALWKGSRQNLIASGSHYADLKTSGSDKIVYCLNTKTTQTTMTLSQASVGGTQLRDLITNTTITANSGSYNIGLNGLEAKFFIVE